LTIGILRLQHCLAVRGDQDRWNVDAVAHEVLLKFHSIHVRHLQIDNQAFRNISLQRSEKFPPGSVSPGTKGARTQQPAQALSTAGSSSTTAIFGEASAMEDYCGRAGRPSSWPLGQ